MDIAEISAHLEIRQALVRIARGVDRRDAELIKSAYHPDATDEHGGEFNGTAHEFADYAVSKYPEGMLFGEHHITNVYVEVDDDIARVESYQITFQPTLGEDGTEKLMLVGNRFIDRFELRNGEWKIAIRKTVMDVSRPDIPGETWEGQEKYLQPGGKGIDPSYEIFTDESHR